MLSLRYALRFNWWGAGMIYAGILGSVAGNLIVAFLFAWIYRIYSKIKKNYNQNAEMSWLIFGILLVLFAAKGNGFFEDASTLINEIIDF